MDHWSFFYANYCNSSSPAIAFLLFFSHHVTFTSKVSSQKLINLLRCAACEKPGHLQPLNATWIHQTEIFFFLLTLMQKVWYVNSDWTAMIPLCSGGRGMHPGMWTWSTLNVIYSFVLFCPRTPSILLCYSHVELFPLDLFFSVN